MLSLLVILRSCIASLRVLNYDVEDHLKKIYDFGVGQLCPQSLPMTGTAQREGLGGL